MSRASHPMIWAVLLAGCARISEGPPTFTDTDFPLQDTLDGPTGPGFVVTEGEDTYPWGLPEGFPRPVVPADNPMTVEKVALGRWLFHEARLSTNGSTSCASCHDQSIGFADPRRFATGALGDSTTRNAPGLQNVGFYSTFNWANPTLTTLTAQHLGPLFGTSPVEMGNVRADETVVKALADDPRYPPLFAAAFPDDADPYTWDRVVASIASFVRSMVSADAPIDRFVYGGDTSALSEDAVAGLDLFFTERLECHHCHGSFHFTRSVTWAGAGVAEVAFDNIGLYDVDGQGSYPSRDPGLVGVTGEERDRGRFRPPSLRNVALTAPYMHDGSLGSLAEIVQHYSAGGRLVTSGPDAGDGRANPYKSGFVHGFELTATETRQLLAFLESLTDETFLTDPRWSDPFTAEGDTAVP